MQSTGLVLRSAATTSQCVQDDIETHDVIAVHQDLLPQASKTLFVDYHLRDYASHAERFAWRQHTFFGGTYQAVWAER